ncbi:flagellar export chaperone FliS [Bacillus sp. DTU_2020_1000418_1_SI_GHA_SEK_038]|uniref:flagellar export chaperone FliS n=1 Tax=Bacillus sp. DTU_2020_1000418_1_SI_GHA_SEK_038 TaxID=3077585 RepID=UPI0028EB1ED0|nr:flagellar export chaperone FliS [Bacillus sp. DTU_2020_1000418_1_SI_GHA_SEK_038]WNS75093.1 flagellar export chaperone FliS [Bacillus sp. DTU_2020_1000418_1_SI_GHA_SEK_038]
MEFLTEEFIYKKSSQEITSLLYEAMIEQLHRSIEDIEEKRFIDANKKLQKINDILYRLGAGLNYEAGIIADQLDTLYNYMAERVIEGNKKKDASVIGEVLSIAERLASSWNEALKNKPNEKQMLHRRKTRAYEQNVMVLERENTLVEEGK